MKKGTLISISVAFLILSFGALWYGSGADVKIVDMHASPIGIGDRGQLNIVLQNNGSKPVDVWLEVENAFVDENGRSYSTSRLIISNNSTSGDEESVSLQKPINLLPGNNSVSVMLGYKLPGKYPVKVKVVENNRLLDEATYLVNIPLPELHLKLEYEVESKNTSDVYRIYGYLINKGLSPARDVRTNLTVTNERTGEIVLKSSDLYYVGTEDKTALWTWPDYPYTIVEIAHKEPTGDSYMPVQNVVVGGSEDRFKVDVMARWQDQVTSAELLIPPRRAGDAYDKAR
ncbi:hypothetical protein RG963_00830 [Methanosarcina sp. Z-7115]|uniref:Uncharacterized protein n=1 Tax=Methanosarcina baikalica TaxID=3073890 RepID=A0ABU2CX86_9EURY|nr:hypothetical protein [Methanosarcina sp. Z-7115]MDR7664348.1 hypothetical protein [Methanosarcina sp. Z-7115]